MHTVSPIPRDESTSGVLDLDGELDFAASRKLEGLDLDELVSQGRHGLEVNLERVDFIDSSGIGALIHLRNRAVSRGLRFGLSAVPVSVERTLVMAGLAELFELDAHV